MPKAKTKKSLAKRFKITGTGKLLRKQKGRSHLLAKKSSKRKRSLENDVLVADNLVKKYKRLIRGL